MDGREQGRWRGRVKRFLSAAAGSSRSPNHAAETHLKFYISAWIDHKVCVSYLKMFACLAKELIVWNSLQNAHLVTRCEQFRPWLERLDANSNLISTQQKSHFIMKENVLAQSSCLKEFSLHMHAFYFLFSSLAWIQKRLKMWFNESINKNMQYVFS